MKNFNFGKEAIINFARKKGSRFIVKSMFEAFKDYFNENCEILELDRKTHIMFLTRENENIIMELVEITEGDISEFVKRKVGFLHLVDDISDCSEAFNLILKGLKAKSQDFEKDLLKFEEIIINLIDKADTSKNAYAILDNKGKAVIMECEYSAEPFSLKIHNEINPKDVIKLME